MTTSSIILRLCGARVGTSLLNESCIQAASGPWSNHLIFILFQSLSLFLITPFGHSLGPFRRRVDEPKCDDENLLVCELMNPPKSPCVAIIQQSVLLDMWWFRCNFYFQLGDTKNVLTCKHCWWLIILNGCQSQLNCRRSYLQYFETQSIVFRLLHISCNQHVHLLTFFAI